MKPIFIISLLLTLFAQHALGQKQTVSKASADTIIIKTSAVCDMCKETLEKAMAYEKGVKSSNLNVDTKMFTVIYSPAKTGPEKIKKAISETGYDADDVPANPKAYENLNPCCKKDYQH